MAALAQVWLNRTPQQPYEHINRIKNPIPKSCGLSQNYQNLFNPETVIEYQLPEAGRVTLKVYNTLGQQIRSLIDEEKQAGYHQVIWDGKNDNGSRLASGVYIYRFNAGKFLKVKKVVLLK